MTKSLGEKLNLLRKQKRLTLERLGEMTETSKSYIWELENKNLPRPSAEKLAKIASALGVTVDYLIDTHEAKPAVDVVDQAFFRKYRNMNSDTKEKIRQIVELWGENQK